jgi:serine/threonine protein kinase
MSESSIVSAAIEVDDPAERAALLDRLCSGDAALRARVEAQLSVAATPESRLDQPPSELIATADYTPAAPLTRPYIPIEGPGTRIGPYKLLQEIGHGGMGAVFLAEQAEPVRRRVALKVIKAGMDTAQVIARFEAERQALALMDHPNIARVLDAGATAAGRPFFVMELVQGIPITRYCDDHRLETRARLELFVLVCQAIQHAHQKGIIHRDIKPSNVLVTEVDGRPSPRVIDFGVAKATNQALTEKTLFTQFGAVVGTPEYMSPEQAGLGSIDVDTRSDVYSLGVLLYELLTGTTPLERSRLRDAAFTEILRRIREEEPPTPSSRLGTTLGGTPAVAANRGTEPARLARQVRGELDWIVMKCLEKDRTRRYETANALARDLQRFLADDPVEAGPPSAVYRLRKFARKNRGVLSTLSAVAVVLLAATAFSLWQADVARRARAQAVSDRNDAIRARNAEADAAARERAVSELATSRLTQVENGLRVLMTIFRDLDPSAESKGGPNLRDQLTKRMEEAAALLDEGGISDPATRAHVQGSLGRSLIGLGRSARAIELLTSARDQLRAAGRASDVTLLSMENMIGLAHAAGGDLAAAIRIHEAAWREARDLLGPQQDETLKIQENLAGELIQVGRFAEAIPVFEENIQVRRSRGEGESEATLRAMNSLVAAYENAGRLTRAVRLAEQTLPRFEALYGPDHADTQFARNNLATVCQAVGRHDDAIRLLTEVVRVRREKLGADHALTLASLSSLAMSLGEAGHEQRANELYRECATRARESLGPKNRTYLLAALGHAVSEGRLGRSVEYVRRMEEILPAARESFGADDPQLLGATISLVAAYQRVDRFDTAVRVGEEALSVAESKLPRDHPMRLIAMNNLAGAYHGVGRDREAAALLEKVVEATRRTLGPRHRSTLISAANLASRYLDLGDEQRGIDLLERTTQAAHAALGDTSDVTLNCDLGLAAVYQSARRWSDLDRVARRALEAIERDAPDSWVRADFERALAACLCSQGRGRDAEPLLLAAYERLSAREAQEPARVRGDRIGCGLALVHLYEHAGRQTEAAQWRERLRPDLDAGWPADSFARLKPAPH